MRLPPKTQYCRCGHQYKLSWYHYIIMIFRDITVRCPQCNTLHKFRLTYFTNEVFDNKTKRDNKQIESNNRVLWSKP